MRYWGRRVCVCHLFPHTVGLGPQELLAVSIATHKITLDVASNSTSVTAAPALLALVPGASMYVLGSRVSQSSDIGIHWARGQL